eukprot:360614-Chlamydomonas_euryale.AAC.3
MFHGCTAFLMFRACTAFLIQLRAQRQDCANSAYCRVGCWRGVLYSRFRLFRPGSDSESELQGADSTGYASFRPGCTSSALAGC